MKTGTFLRLSVLLAIAPAMVLALPQDGLPEAVLKELKAAAVYIMVTDEGDSWTGSGFLFRKEGTTGFVATNAHVADGDPNRRRITAVFNSGMPGEIQLPAEVLVLDYERDLAVLQVKGSNLPKPIDTRSRRKLKETLVVYSVGFPLGGALAAGAKNPEATFGKSSVSSLRLDDAGDLVIVQLDGEVNPGNSGGPAVDESGDLVGIIFAKYSRSQIGFAIPTTHFDDLVQGRAEGLTGEISEITKSGARMRLRTEIQDPFKKLRGVSVMWGPLDPGKPLRMTREPVQSGMKEQLLRMERTDAWGDLVIPSQGKERVDIVLQLKVVRGDGSVVLGFPETTMLDFTDLVTPLDEIRMWQEARPSLKVVENKDKKARCTLELDLLIPRKVRSAAMIVKRPSATPHLPKPGKSEVWGRMGGQVQEKTLVVSESRATGEMELAADSQGGPVTLVLQGMIELEDRRKVFTSPVIHVVPFPRAGTVRPPSRDDWIATASAKNRDAGKTTGVSPIVEDVNLAGATRKVLDASVRTVSLPGKDFVPRPVWSADGRSLFLLEHSGIIRMLSVPEFTQSRRLQVGSACGFLGLSKEGLVVHSAELGELWILDESTLEFRRRVRIAGLKHVAVSPGSSLGYAASEDKLCIVDLKEGRVLKQHIAKDFSKQNFEKVKKAPGAGPLWSWGPLELSADGGTLLMTEPGLQRFRVAGADLAWDEIGAFRRGRTDAILSPDGKYFAVLETMPGSREQNPRPAIYSIKDLSGPVVTLASGTQQSRLAFSFDKEAGKLYCAEYGKQIVIYSPKGERAKQYEIESAASVEFMLAHPAGNQVLMATPTSLYWVDFRN